eukprot:4612504-Ditylum_brightwellii.AAC.1
MLRQSMLQCNQKYITTSLLKYLQESHDVEWYKLLPKADEIRQNGKQKRQWDITLLSDVGVQPTKATLWEWKGRLILVFWYWTPEFRQEA